MWCCGGSEEENYGLPVKQFVEPQKHLHPSGHDNKLPKVPSRGVQKILPIEIPAITLAELNKMTNNFRPKALIAEGSYGRIYYGVLSSGQPAAIKKLDPATCQELPEPDFASQISLVSRLNNEYFLELLGYCLEADNRILIHQYASNGSLHDILYGRRGVQNDEPGVVLTWNQRVKIAYGAARGLEYLHEKVEPPIVHRDIRSSNVLLFDDYAPKIADFNLANQPTDCLARLHSTRVLGTFGYHAPEYAMIGQLTQKGDVYSFGVVLLELLTGRKPVDHTLPKGQQSKEELNKSCKNDFSFQREKRVQAFIIFIDFVTIEDTTKNGKIRFKSINLINQSILVLCCHLL